MVDLYENLATCHPSLSRGQVWCKECGRTQKVDSGQCMQTGWPKCCGYTMTVDSPEEREPVAACPPPLCANKEPCREEVTCTPDTCPHNSQKGWQHAFTCVKHICAHDFQSGPWINYENGGTASCICGETAMSHDMWYGP